MKLLKYILLFFGLGVVIWLIVDTGFDNILAQFRWLGMNSIWFLLPYCAVYACDCYGWRFSFARHIHLPSFVKMFRIRLAGEAINYTTPAAYIGGEPFKALMLSKTNVLLSHSLASVLIAKFLMTVAEVLFIIIGIQLAFLSFANRDLLIALIIGLLLFGGVLWLFFLLQRRGLAKFLSKGIQKIRVAQQWLQSYEKAIAEFDIVLAQYYEEKKQLGIACCCFFLSWCCGSMEIYIFLTLMDQPFQLYQIFVLEALFVSIKGAGMMVPGSVGIQEGGIVATMVLFGFAKPLGVTFSILRRVREIIWIVIGLYFFSQEWDSSMYASANEKAQ